jgi:post-segregation antitoxin (ccd killing protein)
MRDRQVRLREDHYEFVQDSAFTLSGLVREALDKITHGELEFPSERSRDTQGYELVRTAVTVTDEHDEYINSHDVVFSVLVHQVIEQRMERERKLQEWEAENDW